MPSLPVYTGFGSDIWAGHIKTYFSWAVLGYSVGSLTQCGPAQQDAISMHDDSCGPAALLRRVQCFFLRGSVGQLSPGPLIFTWTYCRGHLHDPTPGPSVRTPETTTAPCRETQRVGFCPLSPTTATTSFHSPRPTRSRLPSARSAVSNAGDTRQRLEAIWMDGSWIDRTLHQTGGPFVLSSQ
jgi:hypothetical protein